MPTADFDGQIALPSREDLVAPQTPPSRLVQLLDRAIVVLMVAILLTLSWPVSMLFMPPSHSRMATTTHLQSAPPEPPAPHAGW